MKIAFYTICPSPHQFPLAREIVAYAGEKNFRYVYLHGMSNERTKMGWGQTDRLPTWCLAAATNDGRTWLESADILLSGERDVALFERRAKAGLKTIYSAERWFKPPLGIFRLLRPSYFRMAWRLMRLICEGALICLPMGIWAARDFARLSRLFIGDMRALFYAPRLSFVSEPMGRIDDYPWMRMWGYFVEASKKDRIRPASAHPQRRSLRVLWVGRMLAWKRVDTLFKASSVVLEKFPLELTIVGDGPERSRLEKLAHRLFAKHSESIRFEHSVPIARVRELMAENDVYVLSSNAYEGWGAVVSEALEEGMSVLGTHEAGSSATILPRERLFRCGDVTALAKLLEAEYDGRLPHCSISDWSAHDAAERFLKMNMAQRYAFRARRLMHA